MTSETAKVKSRLSALASSFDDLEELLEPLFAQSLPDTVTALEPIQQAKLQTVLPYLVYDLIFSEYLPCICSPAIPYFLPLSLPENAWCRSKGSPRDL